jgi:predicted transcriptional regulator
MGQAMGRNGNPDPKDVKRAIGERLRKARLEAGGMSQRELGELLGVTERSIQAYEQGQTVPYRFGARLTEVLGVPVSWLWYGDDARSSTSSDQFNAMMEELRSVGAKVDLLQREMTKLTKTVAGPPKAA